jgi:hypothetical protein
MNDDDFSVFAFKTASVVSKTIEKTSISNIFIGFVHAFILQKFLIAIL